jgi:hypothetical protein
VMGQKIVRLPSVGETPIQPQDWILLAPTAPEGLAGKVRQVRSVTAAVRKRGEIAQKFVFLEPDGRSIDPAHVARFAEPAEVPRGRAPR